jgi:hypothetical protein
MGIICLVLGAWFNHNAQKAPPEVRERFSMPWADALAPPPGTPERLQPFGDSQVRVELAAIGVAVAGAKMGPLLWRFGAAVIIVGVVALLVA